jgi:DNA helicase IV
MQWILIYSTILLIILVGVFGYFTYIMSGKSREIYSRKLEIQNAYIDFTELLEDDTYFSKRKLTQWHNKWNHLEKIMTLVEKYEAYLKPLIGLPETLSPITSKLDEYFQLDALYRTKISPVHNAIINGEDLRQTRNETYIETELSKYGKYFDAVESDKLTLEQRRAIIIDEAHNLIVAGAGTGKTSAIIGKAGYILKKGLAKPEEMLLLSFARKPQKEMTERVTNRLGVSLNIRTFHSLGLEILRTTLAPIPTISILSLDAVLLRKKIEELLQSNMKNVEFANKLNEYFLYFLNPIENILDFPNEEEYNKYLRTIEIRTLNGEKVKSYAELEIANYLYINGINYKYEAKYSVDTSDKEHRQYTPDFYLPDLDVWIEHVGIDRRCNTAPWVDRWAYLDGWYWKRGIHDQHGTTLIETYTYERSEGTLLSNLEQKLMEHNLERNPIPEAEVFSKLKELGKVSEFAVLLTKFLNLFKSSTETLPTLYKKIETYPLRKRYKAFLDIFKTIYHDYSQLLKEADEIDFNDMINSATEQLNQGLGDYSFKYILVDEFQDISQSRGRLLKALLDLNPDCVLFSVGDDWQSIYRFTGSDLSIMTQFETMFTPTEVMQLTHTFRFNEKIRDVSSDFIMKNEEQITKQLTADSVDHDGCTLIWYTDLGKALLETLTLIDILEPEKVHVQIIGRYNQRYYKEINQIPFWSATELYKNPFFEKPLNLNLEFITAHKAKGSQADYSIILGLRSGRFGFPCEIEDDPVVQLVLAGDDVFPNSEERRVFYVALTRARKQVFVLADAEKISGFANELVEDNSSMTVIGDKPILVKCPQCKNGIIHKVRHNGIMIVSCNQYPVCSYRPNICPECREGFLFQDPEDSSKYLCSNHSCNFTTQVCPRCKEGYLRILEKEGKFWACSNYYSHQCNFTERIIET